MKGRIFTLWLMLVGLCLGMTAQTQSVVSHAVGGDTMIVILQPGALATRVDPMTTQEVEAKAAEVVKEAQAKAKAQHTGKLQSGVGYRVQVYSDNNQRTAKDNARSRQRAVSQRFSKYRTYVSYNAPYWRTRVGDFTSEREAEAAAAELRKAFPKFSKEIRVVRDRVNN